ncbi:MAG: UDP-N-acetylmuramate dehydrogenase, partial [Cyanobacteria bacterium P01_H01_bin.121]
MVMSQPCRPETGLNPLHSDRSLDVPESVSARVSLAPLTTLRVGGCAEWYVAPRQLDTFQACIRWAHAAGLPLTCLGAGSNLLISDQGLPGLVLGTRRLRDRTFDEQTGQLIAAAGVPLPKLAWDAARRGWRGLEWAAGIPGTLGGAVVMNAGAQGGCTAEYLVETQVLRENEMATLRPAQLDYAYRTSALQDADAVVLQATLQLEPEHDPQAVWADTLKNFEYRKNTQPYHLPNCGSVFRNP